MSGVLNKLIAVKVLAALSVAGLGTGAAAGELPDPVQNLASDAAEVVNVDIPDADDDGPKLSKAERDAAKTARKAAKEAEKAARKAAKPAKGADDAEKPEGAPKGVHPDNHGKKVSECAHNPQLKGRDKGKAVSAVARGEADGCTAEGPTGEPQSSQSKGEAKAAAKAARQAEKDATKAANNPAL